jgi:hypothetical protein
MTSEGSGPAPATPSSTVSGLLLVLAIALAVLALARLTGGPARLGWSDEIVYAVMGRNVASGRGLISNFYDARAIAARGFPLGDVHMPGHALLLAAAIASSGPQESSALAIPALAFVVAGAVLWRVCGRVAGPRAAMAAAAALLVFPSLPRYASSAMAELPVVLVAAVHLLVFWRALERPTGARLLALAAVVCIGATLRESLLALLVPSLLVLGRVPPGRRSRMAAVFLGTLAGYLALVWWPLNRARAPFPFYLAQLLDEPGLQPSLAALARNALANARTLSWPAPHPEQWTLSVLVLVALASPLALVRRHGRAGLLATYTLTAAVATIVPLAFTYTFESWTGLRSALPLAPAAIATLAVLVESIGRPALRRGCSAAAFGVLLAGSALADRALVLDRAAEYDEGEGEAREIEAAFGCRGAHVLVAREAFRYGWRNFPATVVWQGGLPAATLEEVARRAGAASTRLERAQLPQTGEVSVVGCRRD